jgi:hypothetical protein
MIFAKKDTLTKLYLHIASIRDTVDETSSSVLRNCKQYIIQFHTSMTPCVEWMETTEQKISNLAALLAPFGGGLTVNPLKNSGCILSVSLPGKL